MDINCKKALVPFQGSPGFAETQAIMACNKNAAERIKYPRRASSNKRILENEEKIRSVGGDKKIKYLGYALKEYIYYY